MRRFLVVALLAATSGGFVAGRSAQALPHGCYSGTDDYTVTADLFRRQAGIQVMQDKPCSYFYDVGDTYTGSGRFTVSCSGGGYHFHPDYPSEGEDRLAQNQPIPQPCSPGDVVTIEAYHSGTGGTVFSGGAGDAAAFAAMLSGGLLTDVSSLPGQDDFKALCDAGSNPDASVSIAPPVNFSGLLTFGGAVRCVGASVTITSVSIAGTAGYPEPVDAGTAHCDSCADTISVSGTTPARTAEWEVDMTFDVTRAGHDPVHGYRWGRWITSWGGQQTNLYPKPTSDFWPLCPAGVACVDKPPVAP